jgi:nicotinate-nucleotide pyrophosphorylase (carboxylating)
MFNLNEFIALAVKEDLGDGDHTSLATIPETAIGEAKLLVKEDGIIAGVTIAKEIFTYFQQDIECEIFILDGSEVRKGDVVLIVKGKVQVLLAAERLVLNIMQRMSGIATYTRMLVEKIKHTNAQLLDTRKTTPLFRFFEKEAVRIGGGMNHRMGLYDMIMIKDNHVDFSGGIRQAIDRVNHYLNQQHKPLKIEVEVRNFDELNEVLDGGNVHRIMLDNFSVENLKTAVEMIGGRFETEASGGINEQTITAYAETGVQYISVGALTHHVNSLDLSLKATLHDVEK